MRWPDRKTQARRGGHVLAPAIVTPLTKVNLALPFSKITIEEPGKDLAELASVVAALAAVMERTVDEPFLPELRKRAEALAARLR